MESKVPCCESPVFTLMLTPTNRLPLQIIFILSAWFSSSHLSTNPLALCAQHISGTEHAASNQAGGLLSFVVMVPAVISTAYRKKHDVNFTGSYRGYCYQN